MLKKAVVAFIIVVSLIAVIYTTLKLRDLKQYEDNSFLDAIPKDITGYLVVNQPKILAEYLVNHSSLTEDLEAFPFLKNEFIKFLTSDSSNIIDNSILFHSPFALSFLNIQGSIYNTFYFQFQNRKQEKSFKKLIKGNSGIKVCSNQDYNGYLIQCINIKSVIDSIYVTIENGLIISSRSVSALKLSLDQLDQDDNLSTVGEIRKLNKTTNHNAIINLYLNCRNIPNFIKGIVTDQNPLSFISSIGTWCELDINVKDENISMVGFLNLNKKDSFPSILLNNIKPAISKIDLSFPPSTCFYEAFNLGINKKDIRENLSKIYYGSNTGNEDRIIDCFVQNLDEEFAIVHSKESNLPDKYFILRVNSQTQAINNLKTIISNPLPVTFFSPDNETEIPIYEAFKDGEFSKRLTKFSNNIPDKYLSFYGNHLIFSNSIQSLTRLLYSNLLSNTLNYQDTYRDYRKHFSTTENIFIHISPEYMCDALKDVLTEGVLDQLSRNSDKLKKFYGLGIQASKLNDQLYLNVLLNYSSTREHTPVTIWESKLDTSVLSKPEFVVNHYTQEKEILVQDKNSTLYLINSAGLILWKKPIDGPVIGGVEQIDYYKNSKLQFIFNTKSKLYIIDRNGNYVDKFPVKLPSSATNTVAVFDYDSNLDYRFFIACENRSILLMNKKGNIIPGWRFKWTDRNVSHPVIHTRCNNKDYIIITDHARHYILDRQGRNRVTVESDFQQSEQSDLFEVFRDGNSVEYLTSTEDGRIASIIIPSGQTNIYGSKNFENYAFKPLNTSMNQFIFLNSNDLKVVDRDQNIIWEKHFNSEINPVADIYQFSSRNYKIGIGDKNGYIHLFNSDGTEYKGFPLIGTSRFSIGFLDSQESEFSLIVGGTNNYLFNYRVR